MAILLWAFKAVAVIFPILSIGTGAQGLLDPIGFSTSFGLPVAPSRSGSTSTPSNSSPASSYVSLMCIRQLATGVILTVFAYQRKWTESATVLAIIGVLQAGTDGWFLAKGGNVGAGLFHAGPGFGIAALAAWYLVAYA